MALSEWFASRVAWVRWRLPAVRHELKSSVAVGRLRSAVYLGKDLRPNPLRARWCRSLLKQRLKRRLPSRYGDLMLICRPDAFRPVTSRWGGLPRRQ